jgi:uncharacterized protein
VSEKAITIHKLDSKGVEVFAYQGTVLLQTLKHMRIEARFNRRNVMLGPLSLETGDRLVEDFFSDRWYNIFAIYQGKSGALKGWYCNLARPALIEKDHLYQEDLALDLVVLPDGTTHLLDEDEYIELDLLQKEKECVEDALLDLIQFANDNGEGFRRITTQV